MAQETYTKEQVWAELEKIGEAEVRIRLGQEKYANSKRALVTEWLRQRDQSRAKLDSREQAKIAREAAAAAREAAEAAWEAVRIDKTAAKIAKIAVTIAVSSMIVSIIALLLK